MESVGTIYLVATPIGNLNDITYRAVETLKNADMIFAEDTRTARKLLSHYNIHVPLDSYHGHSQAGKINKIINLVKQGKDVCIIPGVSDPAYRLVREAIKNQIPLSPIPGPTAAISALIVSGLPTDKFLFVGFLPVKKGRTKLLQWLKDFPYTMIFYESVHKIDKTLKQLANAFGNRYICIAREMTKLYESFYRGYLLDIVEQPEQIPKKGEFVIVVSGTQFKTNDEERDIS